MVDLMTILGYASSIVIPGLILTISEVMDAHEPGTILAFINFISISSYFVYKGYIGTWFLVLGLILLSLIFAILYKGILGSGSSE